MLGTNRKYKVRFKRRKIMHIFYFYVVNVLLLFLAFLIDNSLSISFTRTPIYSFLIITLVAVSFYLFYTSKYSFSKIQQIKAKLRDVIQYNRMYINDKETNPYRFITSLLFVFYEKDNSLIIESYSYGAPYGLQTGELGKKIESALNLNLTDIKNIKASHITFIFDLIKLDRFQIKITTPDGNLSTKIDSTSMI